MILYLKLISVFIGILYLSVAISTNTSSQLFNQQAYASLDNEINDPIKKACPAYEGNGGITGLVSDIIKACLDRGDTSQPPTTPNPDTTSFPKNWLFFSAGMIYPLENTANIVITDPNSNYSNTYSLITASGQGQGEDSVGDQFVIPIDDAYTVTVTFPIAEQSLPVSFDGSDCQPSGNTCSGTMGIGSQKVYVTIGNPQS